MVRLHNVGNFPQQLYSLDINTVNLVVLYSPVSGALVSVLLGVVGVVGVLLLESADCPSIGSQMLAFLPTRGEMFSLEFTSIGFTRDSSEFCYGLIFAI